MDKSMEKNKNTIRLIQNDKITQASWVKGFQNFITMIKYIVKAKSNLIDQTRFRKLIFFKSPMQASLINDASSNNKAFEKPENIKVIGKRKRKKNLFLNLAFGAKIFYMERIYYPLRAARKYYDENYADRVNRIPPLLPDSKLRIFWDFAIFLVIILNCFIIPIENSFDIDFVVELRPNYQKINFLFNLLMGLDMFLKANTAYYDCGILITNRSYILQHYIKNGLFYDVISLAPKFAIDNIQGSSLASFFFFFKYTQYKLFIERLEHIFDTSEKHAILIALVDLLIRVIFISHFIACSWHAIAFYNDATTRTWLDYGNLRNAPWLEKYLNAAYWIVACMVTCGYGEKVSPQNNVELFFGIWFILIGSGCLGYTISTIGNWANMLSEKTQDFKKNLRIMNRFMRRYNFDSNLQMKIRNYLEYRFLEGRNQDPEREDSIIGNLSYNLKREVYKNTRGDLLMKLNIFNEFSSATMEKLMFNVRMAKYSPEEEIFNNGSDENISLYLIESGEVQLVLGGKGNKKQPIPLKILRRGEMFGEFSFFTGRGRLNSAKSLGFTTILIIDHKDFLSILKENQEDYEKYCMIRDKIEIYRDYSKVSKGCLVCQKEGHILMQCKDIFFLPNKDIIIRKHNHCPKQKTKKSFKRKKLNSTKISALLMKSKLKDAQLKLGVENMMLLEEVLDPSLKMDGDDPISIDMHNSCEDLKQFEQRNEDEKYGMDAQDDLSYIESFRNDISKMIPASNFTVRNFEFANNNSGKPPALKKYTVFKKESSMVSNQLPIIFDEKPAKHTKSFTDIASLNIPNSAFNNKNLSPVFSKEEDTPKIKKKQNGTQYKESQKKMNVEESNKKENPINTNEEASEEVMLFDMRIDQMRNLKVYFPHNNAFNIVSALRKSETKAASLKSILSAKKLRESSGKKPSKKVPAARLSLKRLFK